MIRLLLMRHGVTDWNAEHRLQGRTDRPLTQTARDHLASLVVPEVLQALDLHASPLVRARDTATLVFGRKPVVHPELTEMNWGAFEGQHGADLIMDETSGYRHVEDWGWEFRPPGGESPNELRARLAPYLARLTKPTIAVVHMGVIRVLLAQAHGYDFDGPAPFRIKRDRLYEVEVVGNCVRDPRPEIRLRPAAKEQSA